MKTRFTIILALFSLMAINAQEDIIRNGDFELNDGSGTILGLDAWNIDKESPGSGVGGDAGSRHVYLASDDSTGVYQVVDVVTADSMIYELGFYALNTWQGDSLMVTFSTSDADTSIRTPYYVDTVIVSEGTYMVSFAIPPSSPIEGKKLIVEFQVIGITNGWVNIANIVLIRKQPGQNSPPVADAGLSQTVKGNSLVTLDGSGSTDSDGDPLTYLWKSQHPGISLSDATAEMPTFTAFDVKEISIYNFSLVVNDGTVSSDTAYTSVTVTPAGELIRNADFTERGATWETTNSLKEITDWYMDADALDLTGGIWDLAMIHITNVDPTIYQVVDEVIADTTIYTLTFSAKTSWYGETMNSIFSVSDADTSVRTEIEMQENAFPIDIAGGINTSDFEIYKHVFVIPANSPHVGKKLILEFQTTLAENTDGVDIAWSQIELVSLIKEVIESGGEAIDETLIQHSVVMFPNPASNMIFFKTDAQIYEGQIYSTDGKMVKSVDQGYLESIDVSDLSTGLYVVRLSTNQGIVRQKLQIK